MRHFVLALLLLFAHGSICNQETKATQYEARQSHYQNNAERLIFKVLATTIAHIEASQERDNPYDARKDCLYRLYLFFTILGVLGGICGVIVLIRQTNLLSETVKAAGEQSKAMDRHIGEAARSATAMEAIASTIEDGNQLVMRAYVSVLIGSAVYQQRSRDGEGDLRFEGKVQVSNTGSTPARKVRIRKKAAIVPFPTPKDFIFDLPDSDWCAYATIGPHQNYIVGVVVPDFIPDDKVPAIKEGTGGVLTVWGDITYEDIFGELHTTQFGQQLLWNPTNAVYGYYISGKNETD